jgi:hypothetical protein
MIGNTLSAGNIVAQKKSSARPVVFRTATATLPAFGYVASVTCERIVHTPPENDQVSSCDPMQLIPILSPADSVTFGEANDVIALFVTLSRNSCDVAAC